MTRDAKRQIANRGRDRSANDRGEHHELQDIKGAIERIARLDKTTQQVNRDNRFQRIADGNRRRGGQRNVGQQIVRQQGAEKNTGRRAIAKP